MIAGINVLSAEPIMTYSSHVNTIGGVCIFLVLIGVSSLGISSKKILSYMSVLLLLIGFLGIIIFERVKTVETGKYEYKCTISEDVKLIEFYDKYEIVDVDGKIWTIKEKDNYN